jgi:tRNA nucleotidyltransferase (CCA-adding enzyme)
LSPATGAGILKPYFKRKLLVKIYLVGGAVRDSLLGLVSQDRDYVVVGATSEQMLAQGFVQVGKDFPVFLHPQTREEHALARTERKTSRGYTGFVVQAHPEVTLAEDLQRRDLTINAMAMDADGHILDPFYGQQDIQDKILRHVSPAFVEDPLRVLRVARFAAKLHHHGFVVADETLSLMQYIVASGELSALTPERVWLETEKALMTSAPQIFIEVLRQIGALAVVLPELDALFGVPQPPKWHPEIDTGLHLLLCLAQVVPISDQLATRFAVLCHDLGKGITPVDVLPQHLGHGQAGLPLISALCQRLRVPNELRDLALLVSDLHQNVHQALTLNPKTVVKLFQKMDVWRRPERLSQILDACEADSRGRRGFEQGAYPPKDYLLKAYRLLAAIDVKAIVQAGFQGRAITDELNKQRLEKVKWLKATYVAEDDG